MTRTVFLTARLGRSPGKGGLLLLTLLFTVLAAPLSDEPSEGSAPRPPGSWRLDPTDRELLLLSGAGRFDEVLSLGRSRIASDCSACLPYYLTVKAAVQLGKLESLAKELDAELRGNPLDPYLLSGNAFALRELGREPQALQLLALAVRYGVDCPRVYQSFVEMSQLLERTRQSEVFIELLLSERPNDPYLLFARAYLWTRWGDATRASFAYQEAMLKARPLAMTYYFHAISLLNAAQIDRALSVCRTGLRVTQDEPLPEVRVALLAVASLALELSGKESDGLEAFEQARDLARSYNLVSSEAQILLQRALLLITRGKRTLSRQYLDEAGSHERRLFYPEDKGRYLVRYGNALVAMGDVRRGEEAIHRGLAFAASSRDLLIELEGRIHLAFIELNRGNREAARAVFEAAARDAARLQSEDLHSYASSGLAAAQEQVGAYQDALVNYRKAWLMTQRTGERRAEGLALNNMSLVYFRLGRVREALLIAARANQVARETRDLRLQVDVQQGLAALLAGLGNFQESQKVYQAALDINNRLASPGLDALLWAGWARVTLGLGETERAKEGFEKALVLARSMGSELVTVQALAGLGLSSWTLGRLDEASRHFSEAIDLIESTRRGIESQDERMSYLETRSQVFSSLVAVLMEMEKAVPEADLRDRAFEVVERSRARSLLDLLARTHTSEEVRRGVSSRPHVIGDRPVTALGLRRDGLGNGDLYLEYSLGEKQSFLFISSRESSEVAYLPGRRVIEPAVRDFLNAVASPPRTPENPFDRHVTLGKALFEMLLGPAREKLAESRRLILSPDGVLHFLPFGALTSAREPTHRYLIEQVHLSYVPSATVLVELKRRPKRGRRSMDFLGFAQPRARVATRTSSGSLDLAHIPFAVDEVTAAAAHFPVGTVRLYSDSLATEHAVKSEELSRFRILHFAAHALANSEEPELSAIYLSNDSTTDDDGALNMGEILRLSLSSDLVVLSGCQTGLGQLLSAEGIVGLPWAFLSAGSSSVLVSLWNVNDRSTADLMQFFYDTMLQGADRATSLVEAQRMMLASERRAFQHPYYWAPFVLVGLAD